jgi:pimeloyl-ACP methyl ester carboxylesterase
VQVGWSTGCQLVLEMYRQLPERCSALALLFGPAGRVLETTGLPLPGAWFAPLVRAAPARAFELLCSGISQAIVRAPAIPLGRALRLIGSRTRDADVRDVLAHIGTVDPNTLRAMLLSLQAHSAHDMLPHVRVPLLILAGDRDPFALSTRVGVAIHEAAPGSELVRMKDATHTALLDEPEAIADAVDRLASRAS